MTNSTSLASNAFEKPSAPSRSSTNSSSTSDIELRQLDRISRDATTPEPVDATQKGSRRSPPSSPAEQNFFGALTSRVRGRSRSRSPKPATRTRSRSPMPPPTRMASEREDSPTDRPQRSRQFSEYSGSTLVSERGQNSRDTNESQHPPHGRENFHWQGRHSNSWLFNDFSITDTIKSVTRRARRDS